jgi:hypothetical protein
MGDEFGFLKEGIMFDNGRLIWIPRRENNA